MNKLETIHRETSTNYILTLDNLRAYLADLEAASAANPERAAFFFRDPKFIGTDKITDFKTLREALFYGIEAQTADFKSALDTIEHQTVAARLRRTDEPARVVDISSYLQGVPECFYKIETKRREVYRLQVYNSFPCIIPAGWIAKRAAAIVALAKKIKARGASANIEIIFDLNDDDGNQLKIKIPVNLDALNIAQLAFIISPAFFRTYIFMTLETVFHNWKHAKNKSSQVQGNSHRPITREISFPDGYQSTVTTTAKTKTAYRNAQIKYMRNQFGTPERALATIEKQFETELLRTKNIK